MNRLIFLLILQLLITATLAPAQDPDSAVISRKFELGEITVTSAKSKNRITQEINFKFNRTNVGNSLNSLPSVILQNFGGKNELSVIIRGFDIRSIPVYIDGIPVYIPYDGYMDLGRFQTFDYSVISVSKGLTPMEYGANTIGGSINLISLKPAKKLDVQAVSGFGSGNKFEYGVNLGSLLNKFYFQGSLYNTQSDFFPMSGKYETTTDGNGGKRGNSYTRDQKINFKIGFMPNEKNEYTLNYISQHGEKGTPPYSGNDVLQVARFWRWPAWDKQSLYFISKTQITRNSAIKMRLYYDKFYNKLESFDDDTYSTQTKRYAFTSIYNDHTLGGNAVYSHEIPEKNNLNLSLHYKNDSHKEHNMGEPVRHFNDFTFSTGIDDEFSVSEKLKTIAGLGYNFRKSLKAENYNTTTGIISGFPKNENSALNAQLGADYTFSEFNKLIFYIAHRTRFATLKDRYSYRLGRTIPNPGLNAEQSIHYNLTYNVLLAKMWSVDASVYYIKLNNTIQQVDNVEQGISQMQNTGKAGFKGLELTSVYKFSETVQLAANYSFIEQKNLSNPDLYFTDVPNHKIWANLSVGLFQNFEINLNAEYNTDRYSTSYGTIAEEFDLYNLYISYTLRQFTFFAGMENLHDKNYAYSEGFPAPGRNIFMKILFQM